MTWLLPAVLVGLACWLAQPPPLRWVETPYDATPVSAPGTRHTARRRRRRRALGAGAAGLGAASFAPGILAAPAALVAGVTVWVVLGRLEDPAERRAREAAARDLVHLVGLLASALRAGAAPGQALAVVSTALPGPGADRLAAVPARLALGIDPATVWQGLAADPVLAPLGRALERAGSSGASVADLVDRLAAELGEAERARAEDRARTVGVRAAVPLGLCLLPAFLLLGIVPVVAGLLTTLTG